MDLGDFHDLAFFYYTLQSIYHLEDIPISSLEELDIDMLQRLSKAARFDGIMLMLSVDSYDKNLVVEHFKPDRQAKSLLPFDESPESAIYISNDADVNEVLRTLHNMSARYKSLNPPPFKKYDDDDGPSGDIHTVTVEEFLRGNLEAKTEHAIFMRDNGMHNVAIPASYKRVQLKLIK